MNKTYVLYGTASILLIVIISVVFSSSVRTTVSNVSTSSIAIIKNMLPTTTTQVETGSQYIEITDGCDPYFVGACVNLREGAGENYPVHTRLRTGVVLKVGGTVRVDGKDWYKIIFAASLLYPERVKTDLYVASGDYLTLFKNVGDEYSEKGATTTKRIVVDVSEETLYAYDGDVLFMKEPISTGLEFTPTPKGTFHVFKKTPSRYMQGPIPGASDQVYDLPGVPWDLYFTQEGAVIHGAYWHDNFGKPWSHGCVNLSPLNAKKLYEWTDPGTPVIVKK